MARPLGPPPRAIQEGVNFIRRIHTEFLAYKDDPVVLEVGCNDGMHTRMFLDEFPSIRLFCFEPDPRPIIRFNRAIHDPRVTLYPIALGDTTGQATFYQSSGTRSTAWLDDWDMSGSLLPASGHIKRTPWVNFTKRIMVDVQTLDYWVNQHPEIDTIDFLWTDLQGGEGKFVRGGLDTLTNKVRYFYHEFYKQEMYAGAPTREEVAAMLPDFTCVALFDCDVLLKNTRFK